MTMIAACNGHDVCLSTLPTTFDHLISGFDFSGVRDCTCKEFTCDENFNNNFEEKIDVCTEIDYPTEFTACETKKNYCAALVEACNGENTCLSLVSDTYSYNEHAF